MKYNRIYANPRFKRTNLVAGGVFVVFLIINLFKAGGDGFIFSLNSSILAPLALAVTLVAAALWRAQTKGSPDRRLWLGMMIGWGLWCAAEITWLVYSLGGREVPYPSLADLFWVLGYLPQGAGLVDRIWKGPIRPRLKQLLEIGAISLVITIVATVFIFVPAVRDFEQARWAESVLNFLYPLFDILMIVIVLRLYLSYERGSMGFGWTLLTAAYFVNAISDLMFNFTTWHDLYYPEMQATFVSRMLVDVPYTASYLLFIVALRALQILQRQEPTTKPLPARIWMVRTYGNILISTKSDDTIITTSPNFANLFQDGGVIGKSLGEGLGISRHEAEQILDTLRTTGKVADHLLRMKDRNENMCDVRLCGLVVRSPQGEYAGATFLLRLRVPDANFDAALSQESRAMAGYLLEQTVSSNKEEVAHFLVDYHMVYIKTMIDMALHQAGPGALESLFERWEVINQRRGWNIRLDPKGNLTGTDVPLDVLRAALPVLLETTRKFVGGVISPEKVQINISELTASISETIHRNAVRYMKPGSEAGFSNMVIEDLRGQG